MSSPRKLADLSMTLLEAAVELLNRHAAFEIEDTERLISTRAGIMYFFILFL
jgi:hypothetical protein